MSPSGFEPIPPGVLALAGLQLSERWPEWDDEACPLQGHGWPERWVVAAEVIRALIDAGVCESQTVHTRCDEDGIEYCGGRDGGGGCGQLWPCAGVLPGTDP